MISPSVLHNEYVVNRRSMKEIAGILGCSVNKVVYYMDKYGMPRRTISQAVYSKHNPAGDPFMLQAIQTIDQAKLLGMGIGLYWGEGNKANKYSVRLGNSDPLLIKTFIEFLVRICGINRQTLRFGLQLFSDCDPNEALAFWRRELDVKASQFYKITVTISGSIGTYRRKNKYGVVTVYYHNKKLRDILVGMLPR